MSCNLGINAHVVGKDMEIEKDKLLIRDFDTSDMQNMQKWLTDDRILEFYGGRDLKYTLETLSEHYLEEIPMGFRVIIVYDGKPIGYGQVYCLSDELFEEYDYLKTGKKAEYIFLAPPPCLSKKKDLPFPTGLFFQLSAKLTLKGVLRGRRGMQQVLLEGACRTSGSGSRGYPCIP